MRKRKENQQSADAEQQIRIAPRSPEVFFLRGCKVFKSNGHDILWFSWARLDSFLGHAVVILTARMQQSIDLHTVHQKSQMGRKR